MASRFLIRSARVLTPEGLAARSVLVEGGAITGIYEHANEPGGVECRDFGTDVVMPGVIDAHVHINEPGRTEWEGFATATQAAVAGGVTTVIDMPLNSDPVTTTPEALLRKRGAAEGKLWANCGFYAGLVPANAYHIGDMLATGVLGVKCFMSHSGIEDFPKVGEAELRAALPTVSAKGVPLLVHAEIEGAAEKATDPGSYRQYMRTRPERWENDAIDLLVRLARELDGRVHVVHLAAASALPGLARARSKGVHVSVETAPHYLTFEDAEIPDGATEFKCAPPIRTAANREALWRGVFDGTIEMIASDHSPCPPELKFRELGDFSRAWGGIASLQFLLPTTWTGVHERGGSLELLAELLAARPANLLGLERRKGKIAAGFDADLVVWRPEAELRVTEECIRHRHKLTPYLGRTLRGTVIATLVNGEFAYADGAPAAAPPGRLVSR